MSLKDFLLDWWKLILHQLSMNVHKNEDNIVKDSYVKVNKIIVKETSRFIAPYHVNISKDCEYS